MQSHSPHGQQSLHGIAATVERLQKQQRSHPAQKHSHTRRYVVLTLLAGFLLMTFALQWTTLRTHLQALAMLKELSGEPLTPLLHRFATEPVSESLITIQTKEGPVQARLYEPTLHPKANGMVVFHGVHHLGINEPRLVSFARALSGCGLRVLTPELPDIKDYQVSESSIQVIGETTVWFAQQTGHPVGVLGLSFSGGLSLVAAADPAVRPSMKFVFAVGSQDSMGRVAAYYRTNEDPRPNGTVQLLPAHEYGPLVLEYEHLDQFVPRKDLNAIRPVLRAHLYEDQEAEQLALAPLTPSQKAEVQQLMHADSVVTRTMLQATEQKYAQQMLNLSPERTLGTLTVPVFLLHGEADNIIPAAETLWMASELKATTLQEALISPVLSHLDMSRSPSLWDMWRLVHFMARVLESAESR